MTSDEPAPSIIIMRQLEHGEIGALEAIDALFREELTLCEAGHLKTAVKMGG